jgi:hypothetical protein
LNKRLAEAAQQMELLKQKAAEMAKGYKEVVKDLLS